MGDLNYKGKSPLVQNSTSKEILLSWSGLHLCKLVAEVSKVVLVELQKYFAFRLFCKVSPCKMIICSLGLPYDAVLVYSIPDFAHDFYFVVKSIGQ